MKSNSNSRRDFLKKSAMAGLCTAPVVLTSSSDRAGTPNHHFNVRDFGAVGDGKTKDTAAIQKAIDAANKSGGGRVLLTPGTYLSGTIYLKSNVDFHLMAGAVLYASPDKADYNAYDFCPQNQQPGNLLMTYDFTHGGHLVVALEQDNVTLSGRGRIDGNGKAFIYDHKNGRYLDKSEVTWRPSSMLFICECTRVHIHDLQLFNTPYWNCLLLGCEDFLVDGVHVKNPLEFAPNVDGINIESCQRGTVSNCIVESFDDCTTLRAGAFPLKKKRPCEHITITNCVFRSGCQPIRIGVGEGIIRHCTYSNLVLQGGYNGINLHSAYTGGPCPGVTMENIRFQNIIMEGVKAAFSITLGVADDATKIRNIYYRGISGTCSDTSEIAGRAGNKLLNISFEDIDLAVPAGVAPFSVARFGHITGLRLHNVAFFEWDKRSDKNNPCRIKLTNIEDGDYDRCLPTPELDPDGRFRGRSGGDKALE